MESEEISVTILGSGTSVPTAQRGAPASLVRCPDRALLLDCGSGCATALARAGVGLAELDGILLTHLHPDHVAEILPILFALANPVHPRREADLRIWGPRGTRSYLDQLDQVYGKWIHPRGCEVVVQEVEPLAGFCVGPLRITSHAVEHTPLSLAYRMECGGRVICFSGDSGPCPGLNQAAQGADLFICECSLLEDEQGQGHLRASDAGRIAAAARCDQLILTHLYEHVVAADPLQHVGAHFQGPAQLAQDGLIIRLKLRMKIDT